jgi:hypothetical protein
MCLELSSPTTPASEAVVTSQIAATLFLPLCSSNFATVAGEFATAEPAIGDLIASQIAFRTLGCQIHERVGSQIPFGASRHLHASSHASL